MLNLTNSADPVALLYRVILINRILVTDKDFFFISVDGEDLSAFCKSVAQGAIYLHGKHREIKSL